MFIILCYDVASRRKTRVKKLVRQYLRPVQKTVCEDFLTEKQLNRLLSGLKELIEPECDAVAVYRLSYGQRAEKLSLGRSLKNDSFIL